MTTTRGVGGAPSQLPASPTPRPSSRPPQLALPDEPTEAEFMDRIVAVARIYDWAAVHFRPALRANGTWRTACQYDAKGWPDLVLVHPLRQLVWYRELKARHGRLDDDQALWRNRLVSAGQSWQTWWPEDWPDIVDALSFGQAQVNL